MDTHFALHHIQHTYVTSETPLPHTYKDTYAIYNNNEICFRGYINSDDVNRLKSFIKPCQRYQIITCKDIISKISLVCSFIIYTKFERDWVSPAYVKF